MKNIEHAGNRKLPLSLVVAWVIGTALGTALAGCETNTESSARNRVEAAATAEIVASAKGRIDIEGGVVRLAARRDGVIDKVLVEEGERVKTGQLLATLDDALAKKNLDLARSEVRQAEHQVIAARIRLAAADREVKRLEPLTANDTIARLDFDRAKDEQALARAEVESLQAGVDTAIKRVAIAQREVEERLVRAPMDGQIIQRQARPGNGVSTLNVTPLFLFAPDTPRIVRAELEERFINAVRPGQSVEIVLEADPARRFPGRVLRIGKVVGQRTPGDDPSERQDHRVVETVISVDGEDLLIGQRVIVRFVSTR
ncbi:MAG: efflux RND transporter periplasmic adaptor subunit [Candidatus Manganitrophaceae bacterium]